MQFNAVLQRPIECRVQCVVQCSGVQCAVCSTVMCTPSAKSVAIGTGANNDLATAGQEGRDPQGTCSHLTDIESGPQETTRKPPLLELSVATIPKFTVVPASPTSLCQLPK